jgi:transposase
MQAEEQERIRRAYFIEHKSMRTIAKELKHSRRTVAKAVADEISKPEHVTTTRPTPIFGPYQARVKELLSLNEHMPPKQHYTSHKIFEIIQSEGYTGSESHVRKFISKWNKTHHAPELYIPLEYEPGKDAQCDWGEAIAVIGGVRQTVQIFVIRLNFSRKTFVMAFPSQKQESFFYGHVQAFNHFGGVPWRISYDNLATAVKLAVEGKGRREQRGFVSLRSHYLFESHFCTPEQAHEKGGVEHGVGFGRRNFMVPIPEVASYEALNQYLLEQSRKDEQRRVHGQTMTIGQALEYERQYLRLLPPFEYDCCVITSVRLTPYSQVIYETNRYSVPVKRARRDMIIKAYPFHIEIYDQTTLLARHPRSYEREQDIFDPLHYLSLLEKRPGAFDYAKPLRRWKEDWPESYHRMLQILREKWPEGRGVQEFVRILQLHQEYSPQIMEVAIVQALKYGCVHFDGVMYCLQQITAPQNAPTSLDLADRPHLREIGMQPIDLRQYERLLKTSP